MPNTVYIQNSTHSPHSNVIGCFIALRLIQTDTRKYEECMGTTNSQSNSGKEVFIKNN